MDVFSNVLKSGALINEILVVPQVVQIFLSISETDWGVQETDNQKVTETFGIWFSHKAFS